VFPPSPAKNGYVGPKKEIFEKTYENFLLMAPFLTCLSFISSFLGAVQDLVDQQCQLKHHPHVGYMDTSLARLL
jgi:hypothetical protein